MKKILSILMCAIVCVSFVGCSKSTMNNNDSSNLGQKESVEETEQEIIQYVSKDIYEKGICGNNSYYSRWLNFHMTLGTYNLVDPSLSGENANLNNGKITEMEAYQYINNSPELGEKKIGIYVEQCNGKPLQQMVEESKKTIEKLHDNITWKPDEKIILCNQEYQLLRCVAKTGVFENYYLILHQIKDNRFVTIQRVDSYNSKKLAYSDPENKLNEFISDSWFEEFSGFDKIYFGDYEQDGDQQNGKEKIEWYVLKKEGNKALIVSKYGLDYKSFHSTDEDITWENSSIRQWLNNDFLNSAFDAKEQAKILTTNVLSDKNPEHEVTSGANTQDDIFLLSHSEIKDCFVSENDDICPITQYAYNNISGDKNSRFLSSSFWLTRTPGKTKSRIMTATGGEEWEYSNGHSVGFPFAIRPAMWITLE